MINDSAPTTPEIESTPNPETTPEKEEGDMGTTTGTNGANTTADQKAKEGADAARNANVDFTNVRLSAWESTKIGIAVFVGGTAATCTGMGLAKLFRLNVPRE